jgi:hypothetical protein
MAMAGQMVKRSVTRCEICCEGNSPGTQFGGQNSYSPIAARAVRGSMDYTYFLISNLIGAMIFSFGSDEVWR